jgi:intein/homing endonuclease
LAKHGQTHTEVWLSYIAGYIDGDGCFRWNQSSPEVSVTNCFPYTLHQLAKHFGGTVRSYDNKKKGRTYFQWRVYGDAAIHLVELLRPYLWEKLPQAELVLAIREERPGPRREALIRQLSSMKQIDYKEGS